MKSRELIPRQGGGCWVARRFKVKKQQQPTASWWRVIFLQEFFFLTLLLLLSFMDVASQVILLQSCKKQNVYFFLHSFYLFAFSLFYVPLWAFAEQRSRLFKTLMNWFYSSRGFRCCCSDYWTAQWAAWCVQGSGLGVKERSILLPPFTSSSKQK